jgi:stalled ribosome rescue protein Dom34
MSKNVAVWLDHKEARVFAVHVDKVDEELIAAPHHLHHKHPRGPEGVKDHPEDTKRFFRELASSLEGAEQVLIVGPSTAKLEFLRYIEKHDHALGPKVVGMETVDHPTDGQLAAYAKSYFKRVERMQ